MHECTMLYVCVYQLVILNFEYLRAVVPAEHFEIFNKGYWKTTLASKDLYRWEEG